VSCPEESKKKSAWKLTYTFDYLIYAYLYIIYVYMTVLCGQLSLCVLSDQVKRALYLFKYDPQAADAELAKTWEKLQASRVAMYQDNIVLTSKTRLKCMFVTVQMVNYLMC